MIKIRRNIFINRESKGSVRQKIIIMTLALCCLMLLAVSPQTGSAQDDEKFSDSLLIIPTDWNSLKEISMSEDDCEAEKKCESCLSNWPKPQTTMEASGGSVSDCPGMGKVLAAIRPCYPQIAQAAKASGVVDVLVVVDEAGQVIWARVWRGHPLLHFAAIKSACQWRFTPSACGNMAHKVNRMISFNFRRA